MLSKRRPIKSVYGKGREIRQSDLLWDEAITASPIKLSKAADTDSTLPGRTVLGNAEPNTLPSRRKSKTQDRKQDSECLPPANSTDLQDEGHPTEMTIDNFSDKPLQESTPLRSASVTLGSVCPPTHIIFASSNASLADLASPAAEAKQNDGSKDDTSTLSSLESTDDLNDLTDALQKLKTSQDEQYDEEHSIARDEDLHDIKTLLDLCEQCSAEDFSSYILAVASTSSIVKLGEASFSEVFLGVSRESYEETVYKVIPFGESTEEIPINDIVQELRICSSMSSLAGFVKVKGMKIVQGQYPEPLIQAWDAWATLNESESARPDWYTSTQRYCVVALENGGTDLEHYRIQSWTEALDLLKEILETMTLGEREREFEHRDLHWGNILIKQTSSAGEKRTTIIDYTLSRALVRDRLSDIAFYGFADRAIFEAEGDDYQFDMYRLMRDLVTDGDSEAENWTKFFPSTNALWIHYLVDKLLYAKDLQKPALRVSKRTPILDEEEVQAWRTLASTWKLLNPRRKYKMNENPIDSACRVLELIQ